MTTEEDFLAHFGVKGMRWGHRKREESGGNESKSAPQKPHTPTSKGPPKTYDAGSNNGSMTPSTGSTKSKPSNSKHASLKDVQMASDMMMAKYGPPQRTPEEKAAIRRRNVKIGAAVVATGLVAYGGYKVSKLSGSDLDFVRDVVKGRKTPLVDDIPLNHLSDADKAFSKIGFTNKDLYHKATAGSTSVQRTPESIIKFGAIMDRFNDLGTHTDCVFDDKVAEAVIRQTPGFSVKSGQTIFRMSASEDFSLGKDYSFVNLREQDHLRYKALYSATVGGDKGRADGIFSHTITVGRDIRVASGEDVLSAAKSVAKGLDPFRNYDVHKTEATSAPAIATYLDVQAIIKGGSYKDRPGTKALVEELKKRGFNGMPDFADNGRSTNSAVILFDPKTLVKSKVSEKMTPEKVIEAIMTANPNPFDD